MFATFQACRRLFFFTCLSAKKNVLHVFCMFGQYLLIFVNICPISVNICQCTVPTYYTLLRTVRYSYTNVQYASYAEWPLGARPRLIALRFDRPWFHEPFLTGSKNIQKIVLFPNACFGFGQGCTHWRLWPCRGCSRIKGIPIYVYKHT